jgi:hemerythrin-like domain-containing protein
MTAGPYPDPVADDPHGGTVGSSSPRLRLTAEHARLLRQVTGLVDDLLNAIASAQWPGRQLQTLVGFLQTEVLQQATREEHLLFPAHATPSQIARLNRDHARVRAAVDVLQRAASGESSQSHEQLAATARSLLNQLRRHLNTEEELLAMSGEPHQTDAAR